MTQILLKVVKNLFGISTVDMYAANLEKYISSRYPKTTGDIDKLTIDYNNLFVRSKII